jgi:uncharacterized protein with PQ loop repeat
VTYLDVIGWVAAIVSSTLCIPQLVRARRCVQRNEPVSGVAPAMLWLVLVNAVLWAVWALGSGAYPAGLPSLVSGPAAALTLWTIRRREVPAAVVPVLRPKVCGCGWPDPDQPHVIVVTAAPGAGSRMPCGGGPDAARFGYPAAA